MLDLYIAEVALNRGAEIDELAYPFNLPIVRQLKRLTFEKQVTFLVGENGAGKSTLLEAIAVNYGFNPEGGSRNLNFSTAQTHSELHRFITVSKGPYRAKDGYFLRAESFYNVASEIDRIDPRLKDAYGGKSLHAQSHGESFVSLVSERFFGRGLYLLDEPEAALSPSRQMALLCMMHDLVKRDSQFIIATHSPIILAYPDAQIFQLNEDGIASVPYRETEHYLVTRQFLNNPEGMLKILLE